MRPRGDLAAWPPRAPAAPAGRIPPGGVNMQGVHPPSRVLTFGREARHCILSSNWHLPLVLRGRLSPSCVSFVCAVSSCRAVANSRTVSK